LWRRDALAGVLREVGDRGATRAESERIVQRGERALGLDPAVAVWRSSLGLARWDELP
jgi:hypothetical protein